MVGAISIKWWFGPNTNSVQRLWFRYLARVHPWIARKPTPNHPIYFCPGPCTSIHRSSNAFTISLDTCPKNAAENVACTGFENANARSSVTSVGPALCDMACASRECGSWGGWPALGWGDLGEAGWKRHIVERVLKRGVEEDATA